jgi:putative flavoprotein involved in K+ transport
VRDVLVVGAGPAGLATSHALTERGIGHRLVDRRGRTGGAYLDIYEQTELASPARFTALPGLAVDVAGEYVRAGEYRDYLERYAQRFGIEAERAEVRAIEARKQGFADRGFEVTFIDSPPEPYRAVVIATGMFDHPVVPAIAASLTCPVLHSRDWRGPTQHAGSRVLVVGGATSAVEIAEECAELGVDVTVSARSGVHITRQRYLGRDLHAWLGPLERLPLVFARRFCERRPTLPAQDRGFRAHLRHHRIRVRGAIERVAAAAEGRDRITFAEGDTLVPDVVVLATGFRHATPFLPAEVERTPAGHPRVRDGQSVSWPGLYFVGAPCGRGLDSEFLRGFEQDARLVAARLSHG